MFKSNLGVEKIRVNVESLAKQKGASALECFLLIIILVLGGLAMYSMLGGQTASKFCKPIQALSQDGRARGVQEVGKARYQCAWEEIDENGFDITHRYEYYVIPF